MANLKIKLILLAWLQLQPMLCMTSGASIESERRFYHGNNPSFQEEEKVEYFRSKQPVEEIQCGQINPSDENESISAKIINGNAAKPGEFPFQVAIDTIGNGGILSCGGVLIDKEHVLTSASCIQRLGGCNLASGEALMNRPTDIRVRLGDYSTEKDDGEVIVQVRDLAVHQNYSCTSMNDNIALLRLVEPVDYKLTEQGYGSINRVCMQPDVGSNAIDVGTKVVVTGWGRTKTSSDHSDILQSIQLEVEDMIACRISAAGRPIKLSKTKQICAANKMRAPGSVCYGDKGGPMVRMMGDDRYELVGLVSFGSKDCGKHAVYTRVSYYLDWIADRKESW